MFSLKCFMLCRSSMTRSSAPSTTGVGNVHCSVLQWTSEDHSRPMNKMEVIVLVSVLEGFLRNCLVFTTYNDRICSPVMNGQPKGTKRQHDIYTHRSAGCLFAFLIRSLRARPRGRKFQGWRVLWPGTPCRFFMCTGHWIMITHPMKRWWPSAWGMKKKRKWAYIVHRLVKFWPCLQSDSTG